MVNSIYQWQPGDLIEVLRMDHCPGIDQPRIAIFLKHLCKNSECMPGGIKRLVECRLFTSNACYEKDCWYQLFWIDNQVFETISWNSCFKTGLVHKFED